MGRQFGGNSSDLAEIIIDYKKKKIDILDPHTKKRFNISYLPPFPMGVLVSIIIAGIIYVFNNNLNFYFLWLSLYLLIWELNILYLPLSNYFHFAEQSMIHNWFVEKKVVIVKNLDNTIYKLPYEFQNFKLTYKCYGDYKKYLLKIHIFPKDYYLKRRNTITKQTQEWEAWFYFSKIPRTGKMEVEFI